jgi:hypothetical protein
VYEPFPVANRLLGSTCTPPFKTAARETKYLYQGQPGPSHKLMSRQMVVGVPQCGTNRKIRSPRICETEILQSMVMRMRMISNHPGSVTGVKLTFEACEENR